MAAARIRSCSTPPLTANVDTIADFNLSDDTIHGFARTVFSAIVGTGTLSLAQFAANASGTYAQDADDRIIYETDTPASCSTTSNGSRRRRLGAVRHGRARAGHDQR